MTKPKESHERINQNYSAWRKAHFSASERLRLKHSECINNLFSVYIETNTSSAPSWDHTKLAKTIESLRLQTYKNIEATICCEDPSHLAQSRLLHQWKEAFLSLRGLGLDSINQGHTATSPRSEQISWRGEYLLCIEEGTIMEHNAFELLNTVINAHTGDTLPEIVVIDHEHWDPSTESSLQPYFFPGWDPDLMSQKPGLGQACAVSRNLVSKYGNPAGSQDNKYRTRMNEWIENLAKRYPWPEVAHLTSPVMRICSKRFLDCKFAEPAGLTPPGGLSIVIPNKNNPDLLKSCLQFLGDQHQTDIELIIVDNGSTDPEVPALYEDLKKRHGAIIISMPGLFNYSKLINAGAKQASREYLLLLNNDVIIPNIATAWSLLSLAAEPTVGVVGSILLYPSRHIQHAGIVLTQGPCASHVMRNASEHDPGPGHILRTLRNYQAVTGALQIMRTSIFREVNGYDEVHLPVEFNDIDFCLRVRKKGYKVLCAPMHGIIHAESSTRQETGSAETLKSRQDAKLYMARRWREAFSHDPFLNPNLSISDTLEPGLMPINS